MIFNRVEIRSRKKRIQCIEESSQGSGGGLTKANLSIFIYHFFLRTEMMSRGGPLLLNTVNHFGKNLKKYIRIFSNGSGGWGPLTGNSIH